MLAASGESPPEVLIGICTYNLVQEGMLDLFLAVSRDIFQLLCFCQQTMCFIIEALSDMLGELPLGVVFTDSLSEFC